jgi:catecholate siderophore receptor
MGKRHGMQQSSNEPKTNIYFGLRQQMIEGAQGKTAAPSEGSALMRSGLGALQKGTSVAAMTLMNMAMFAGSAEAQAPVAPAAAPKKKAPTAEEASAVELSEVTVTDQYSAYRTEAVSSPKYNAPLKDIPQTINVVPQTIIKEQNATNLRDVLRNVPGISIQAGEGGVPAGDNLSIRGFNARTDLFIDGVRDTGGYARDSFNFEQVEVVKGPASTYTGRGSTGGSVNIVTKAPRQNAFYRGEAGYGTDNYKRFTIDLNQPISLWNSARKTEVAASSFDGKSYVPSGKTVVTPPADEGSSTAFRLNAVFHEADYPGRDEVSSRRWGVAPSFALGLGTPTTVTFTYMHFETDNVPDYGIPWVNPTNIPLAKFADKPAPVSFGNWYGLHQRDFEKTRTDLGTIEFKHQFNDDFNMRYLVRYGRTIRDSLITAPRFNDPNSTDVSRNLQSRDQEDTILANQIDFNGRFNTFGIQHALIAGVEYIREDSENFLRAGPAAPLANLRNPDPNDSFPGSVRRTGAVNEANTESLGIYVFDTMKLGKHWELSGGLRYDYFSVDYDQTAVGGAVTGFESIDKMLSWRAALSYKPTENGTIYVAYGTSFNPSAEGLTLSAALAPLDPEENSTFEIGTKWDLLDKRITVSAAVFRTEKENARTPGLSPNDPPQVLAGEQTVQGFEIGVTGNLTADWAVYAGYTYLDSEIKASNTPTEVGNELPNTPENSFNIWTTYRLTQKLDVGVGAQFVDSRFSAANNHREAPSYWTVDAMVAYQLTENINLRLNVYNLADEEYIDRVGGGHFIPGPGRSGTITAGFKF